MRRRGTVSLSEQRTGYRVTSYPGQELTDAASPVMIPSVVTIGKTA
jgi:hypothetical protein